MKIFRERVSVWNCRVFGIIFEFRSLARLEGIQRALSTRRSQYLLELELKVRQEHNEALSQEESLWRQKSRISWLQGGEQNTKFFHLSVLNRRRLNLVTQLKDASGQWCMDPTLLKIMVREFYENLYKAGGT